jgi:uncharacterized protein (TIGR00251 family)
MAWPEAIGERFGRRAGSANKEENWQVTEGLIEVRLTPRASGSQLMGIADGTLRARVTAPPVDDKANKALCRLIAKRIDVASSRVAVVHGGKSRTKTVGVKGWSAAGLKRAL